MRIVIVPGTNRAGSLSYMLAQVVREQYESLDADTDLLDLKEMDAEFLLPSAYKEPGDRVRGMVKRFMASDGVVFIVPEYNGSYPGVLKLFIDMLPYPDGFDSRPVSFIGLAAGEFQSLRAVEHLQGVTGYRNAFHHPRRTFIGKSYERFDMATGKLKEAELEERLMKQARSFVDFIERIKAD
ncbi:MAG: NAD(P)H-dependent oxidoreductase [Planctomycetes bacterium]|nr:NAD(P)H-dependent oxidoreductase [Planctomycetota bacterium]